MLKKCQYPGKLPEQTFTVNQSEKSYTFVKTLSQVQSNYILSPMSVSMIVNFCIILSMLKRFRNISIYFIVKFENL